MFRILVVDDSPNNLDLTSRMLLKAGYGVDTAPSGEEAVAMAGLWRYDLIVMDMVMPGLSGSEATKIIRNAESVSGIRRVPVIAFTVNGVEEFRQRAMRSDMDDFITKPIERRQFLAAVERSVDDRAVVLVADDRASDRDRTLRYLRGLDRVGIVSAGSGAEAIAACERQRISLALVNVGLPDLGGVEVAARLRSCARGKDIEIVLVGEKGEAEAGQYSEASRYAGCLEKPFGQAELLKVVQPLLAAA
jgi:CheY-like chemotaxis protein